MLRIIYDYDSDSNISEHDIEQVLCKKLIPEGPCDINEQEVNSENVDIDCEINKKEKDAIYYVYLKAADTEIVFRVASDMRNFANKALYFFKKTKTQNITVTLFTERVYLHIGETRDDILDQFTGELIRISGRNFNLTRK